MSWIEWEDWTARLYDPRLEDGPRDDSVALLSDPDRFREAAVEMLREWPASAVHNLEHLWSGRNSWLGQATCCYSHGATGNETRAAWGLMSNADRDAANAVAVSVREEWERSRRDAQTSFEL
jgi:hypothetical protein